MKTRFIFMLAFFACSSLVWYGCSNSEDSNLENNSSSELNSQQRTSSFDINSYLSDFYGTSVSFGDSISVNGSDLKVKGVNVGRFGTRGYVAFDNTNEAVYFIDVDRENYVITSVELGTMTIDTDTDINLLPFYSENEFDFLEILDTVNKDEEDAYDSNYPGLIETDWTFWGKKKKCGPPNWDNSIPRICTRWCSNWRVRFFFRFADPDSTELASNCNP